jgi:hypothetical protein
VFGWIDFLSLIFIYISAAAAILQFERLQYSNYLSSFKTTIFYKIAAVETTLKKI